MLSSPSSHLITTAIMATQLEAGVPVDTLRFRAAKAGQPAERILARSVRTLRRRRHRQAGVPWSAAELHFLRHNSGRLSTLEIARELGRTWVAVSIKQKRLGLLSVRGNDDVLVAHNIAELLGIGCAKTIQRWMDLGMLPCREMPVRGKTFRVVRRHDLVRFAVNPLNWVYFDTAAVTDAHLQRLIALRQARWGDEWWSTGQAADWYAANRDPRVEHADINRLIRRGYLSAVQIGNSGAFWRVRRSHITAETFTVPKGKGGRAHFEARRIGRRNAYILLWHAVGFDASAICRLVKSDRLHLNPVIAGLCNSNALDRLIDAYALPLSVRGNDDGRVVYADWRLYANRLHGLRRAWAAWSAGIATPAQARLAVVPLRAWLRWHGDPSNPTHRRMLRAAMYANRVSQASLDRMYGRISAEFADLVPTPAFDPIRRLPATTGSASGAA